MIQQRLDAGCTLAELARDAGVPERRLRSIIAGEQEEVRFGTADRIVTYALDGPDVWHNELVDLFEGAA